METFTGKPLDIVTFLMGEGVDKEALYDLTKHKEPRSKKANAYFHRLVGLLAKGEKTKFFEKKNELILQYGNHELVRDKDGKLAYVLLDDNDNWKSDIEKHYFPTEYRDDFCGVKKRAFVMFAGTSTYNSKDMAHLIDCTRNECLGCGIPITEVETYEEKQLMEELRRKANAQTHKGSSNNATGKTGS